MSSTASNYDLRRLHLGVGVAALATAMAFALSAPILLSAKRVGVWFSVLVLAYGAMMFGSSYVEEEQHFWYWMASAWFGWLYFKAWGSPASPHIMKLLTLHTGVARQGARRQCRHPLLWLWYLHCGSCAVGTRQGRNMQARVISPERPSPRSGGCSGCLLS